MRSGHPAAAAGLRQLLGSELLRACFPCIESTHYSRIPCVACQGRLQATGTTLQPTHDPLWCWTFVCNNTPLWSFYCTKVSQCVVGGTSGSAVGVLALQCVASLHRVRLQRHSALLVLLFLYSLKQSLSLLRTTQRAATAGQPPTNTTRHTIPLYSCYACVAVCHSYQASFGDPACGHWLITRYWNVLQAPYYSATNLGGRSSNAL